VAVLPRCKILREPLANLCGVPATRTLEEIAVEIALAVAASDTVKVAKFVETSVLQQ
jgi:hypothetical protein